MPLYKNLGGESAVSSYEFGTDWIEIVFQGSRARTYLYTYASAGRSNVEEMKRLAHLGEGLNSFIMRNVKTLYASKR